MKSYTVTDKGQITIPIEIRQKLGIHQGMAVNFIKKDNYLELHVVSDPAQLTGSGFGLIKSARASVPASFDVTTLPGVQ
ncbi:MAG: AbrB/MazE/SpoVT family DNA-binding domain-containing protein [Methylococcales bacterium]